MRRIFVRAVYKNTVNIFTVTHFFPIFGTNVYFLRVEWENVLLLRMPYMIEEYRRKEVKYITEFVWFEWTFSLNERIEKCWLSIERVGK